MTLETGVVLVASALMAMALGAQALGLSGAFGQRRWHGLVIAARVGAVAALATALVLAVVNENAWTPSDLRHLTLSLALAVLAIQLALTWGCRTDGAGPVIDLFVLALSLVIIGVRAGTTPPTCTQSEVLFLAQWGLFVVGAGAAVVAGSAGLMLLLRRLWARIGWEDRLPPRDGAEAFLQQATLVTLAALGSGLVTGAWLAWRHVGAPPSRDPRSTWMAITWLVAAMSHLAWRLRQRPPRRALGAAILGVSAAFAGIFGTLAITGIGHVLGM